MVALEEMRRTSWLTVRVHCMAPSVHWVPPSVHCMAPSVHCMAPACTAWPPACTVCHMFNHTDGSSADVLYDQLSSFLSRVIWLLTQQQVPCQFLNMFLFVHKFTHMHDC